MRMSDKAIHEELSQVEEIINLEEEVRFISYQSVVNLEEQVKLLDYETADLEEEEVKLFIYDQDPPDDLRSTVSASATSSSEGEPRETPVDRWPPCDGPSAAGQPDSEYLKRHLGLPLTLALADVARRCPRDPINYLAHWLLRWRWGQERKQREHDRTKELAADEERYSRQMEQEKMLNAMHSLHDEFTVDELRVLDVRDNVLKIGHSLSAQYGQLQSSEEDTAGTDDATAPTSDAVDATAPMGDAVDATAPTGDAVDATMPTGDTQDVIEPVTGDKDGEKETEGT